MKLELARQIVGEIIEWQMVVLGIKARHEIQSKVDLSIYSLADIIKANDIVESDNNKRDKVREWHRGKGHNVKPHTVYMVLADRLIAAVYTALSFDPDGEMIALINDRAVGVVEPEY